MGLMISVQCWVHGVLRSWADKRLPQAAHLLTGERGEDAAFFYLRKLGYTVVARRWRSERLSGDLDLVAWDGDTLVIFEVKTRTGHDRFPAESMVHQHKKHKLRQMAQAYVGQLPKQHRSNIILRFDVLAVYLLPEGPEIEHFVGAFPRQPAQAHPRAFSMS